MALQQNQPENYNILSPISYRLIIEKFPLLTFWCQTANIPGISTTEGVQSTPFREIPIIGEKIEFETLDITMIVDEDLANFKEIMDWMTGFAPIHDKKEHTEYLNTQYTTSTTSDYQNYLSDAILHVLTNSKGHNKEILFHDIFPTSLGAIAFDSTGEVDPITTDVSFQIRDYVINE
jgi:hypothetical protein